MKKESLPSRQQDKGCIHQTWSIFASSVQCWSPSYNKSQFIHQLHAQCLNYKKTQSSHRTQTSKQALKMPVQGQRYIRMPCCSLPAMLLWPLKTWESGWGSSTGSRRQILTRSDACIDSTSNLLVPSLSSSHVYHSSQTTDSPFWFSLAQSYSITGSIPDLISFPCLPSWLCPGSFLPKAAAEHQNQGEVLLPEIPEDKKFSRK